jgi:hypothetical protein
VQQRGTVMDLVAVMRYAATVAVIGLESQGEAELTRIANPAFIICSSLFSHGPQDFDFERLRK